MVRSAKAACKATAENWLRHPRLRDTPLIRLRLAEAADGLPDASPNVLDLEALSERLAMGRRVVLEAPAGAGKTTTLAQLAALKTLAGDLCLIVDLPAWVNSDRGLLDYVGQSPDFLSHGVTATELARLSRVEHLDILFNGWNEVSDTASESARLKLAEVERAYPAAGILVATRPGLKPPLPGATRVRVLRLTAAQRHEYLSAVLGRRARELEDVIEGNPTIGQLAANPLMLAEITELFRSGRAVPETTLEILAGMRDRIESMEEHRDALTGPPLMARAGSYLSAIAKSMTVAGATEIDEPSARRVVAETANSLRESGQIVAAPDPSAALRELCAHHVLERQDYPSESFRFQHELLQEFFAALAFVDSLMALATERTEERAFALRADYLNRPSFEASLLTVAEAIGAGTEWINTRIGIEEAGRLLVEQALQVDALFAASLARLCGERVWVEVGPQLGTLFRGWMAVPNETRRRYGLACILATGSAEFSDLLVPLVTDDDQQVSLRAYRALGHFYPSSLGDNWRELVAGWEDEQRTTFVEEVVQASGLPEVAEDFALNDPSERVRVAAMRALDWMGSTARLERVGEGLTDETLSAAVLNVFRVESVPESLRPRVLEAVGRRLTDGGTSAARVRLATMAAQLSDSEIATLKGEVRGLSTAEVRGLNDYVVEAALTVLQGADPTWSADWIAQQVADGGLYGDRWIRRATGISSRLLKSLLERALTKDIERGDERGTLPLLAQLADKKVSGEVCRELIRMEAEGHRGWSDEVRDERSAILRQLKGLARALPPQLLADAMLGAVSKPPRLDELRGVLDVIGVLGDEWGELRAGIAPRTRDSLRSFLADSVPVVLTDDDHFGSLKASLALAIGRLGDPKAVELIEQLIEADIERVREGLEARRAGERGGLANGATTTHASWYTRALTWLGEEVAAPRLILLLDEIEYEEAAASALSELVRTPSNQEHPFTFRRGLTITVPTGENEASRRRFSLAITTRIEALLDELRDDPESEWLNLRVKRLAVHLASLERGETVDLVLQVMSLGGRFDAWYRLDALEHLIRRGVRPPTEGALAVVESVIAQLADRGQYNDQTEDVRERALLILPFLEDADTGIDRLQELLDERPLPQYREERLLEALGTSGSDRAFDTLVELYEEREPRTERFTWSWIKVVSQMEHPRASELILSFLDPELEGVDGDAPPEVMDMLGAEIARIAGRSPQMTARLIELCTVRLSPARRELLGRVISEFGSPELTMAGLDLIDDDGEPPVLDGVRRALERALVEHRPHGESSNVFTLVPRSGSELRARLFHLFTEDESRSRSAEQLLGDVDDWRLDHGKPASEPRHPAIESGGAWPPTPIED